MGKTPEQAQCFELPNAGQKSGAKGTKIADGCKAKPNLMNKLFQCAES